MNLKSEKKKIKGLGLYYLLNIKKYLGLNSRFLVKRERTIPKLKFLVKEEFYLSENIKLDEYFYLQSHNNVGSWKIIRKKYGLPVRGQRTKTNAKTLKKLNKNKKKFV